MKPYFFTFDFYHLDHNGYSLHKCYCTIPAYTSSQARHIMHALRGRKWTSCYENSEKAGVKTHNLRCVHMNSVMLPPDEQDQTE